MASELIGYDILIAAPGDVPEECKIVRDAIVRWNQTNKDERKVVLSAKQWISDVVPEMGGEPQSIVNKQIVAPSDVLIGIFWTRIGTPTKSEVSGTVEEIEKFIKDGKPVLLYFSEKKVIPANLNRSQYDDVQGIRKKYQAQGFVKTISSLAKFKEELIYHLTGVVSQLQKDRSAAIDSIRLGEEELEAKNTDGLQAPGAVPKSIRQNLANAFRVIEKISQGNISGMSTGFYDLDVLTAGFQNKDLIVISGYAGHGKSTFIRSIACNMAVDYKKSVAYFIPNGDSTNETLLFLARQSQTNSHLTKTGRLPQRDFPRLAIAVSPLSDASLFVDDTANQTAEGIRNAIIELNKIVQIDIVFIDNLYSLRFPSSSDSVHDGIFKTMQSLKNLAWELNIPIVVTCPCQPEEKSYFHEPRLSDIDRKSPVSDFSDLVGFIYRNDIHDMSAVRGAASFSVHKHRNGPVGTIPLTFISDYPSFVNHSKPPESDD